MTTDQPDTRRLMEGANEALRVEKSVLPVLEELASSEAFAREAGSAVMREDSEAIVRMLRDRGVEGDVAVEELTWKRGARSISVRVCVTVFGREYCKKWVFS